MTLCYYLGDDVEKSHLQFNPQWQFTQSNLKGLYDYINQLTLGTNYLLGKYRPGQPNWEHTMCKFQDFSTNQILHEIDYHFDNLSSSEF